MIPFGGNATGDLEIERLVTALVTLDKFPEHGFPGLVSQRVAYTDGGETVLKPPEVMAEAEQFTAIDRDNLIDTVTEQEATIHDRHPGLIQWQEDTVQAGDGHDGGAVQVSVIRSPALFKVEQGLIHDALPEGAFTDVLQGDQLLFGNDRFAKLDLHDTKRLFPGHGCGDPVVYGHGGLQ